MNFRFLQYSHLVIISGIMVTLFVSMQDTDPPKKLPQEQDKIEVPAEGPDAIARRDSMRSKLMYSQNIFEGLTTGDFGLIRSGLNDIHAITEGETWIEVDDERYIKLTEDFKTTIKRLADAADTGNIDAAALRYYQMSTSCIDCHKHIRKAGYDF